MVTPSLLGFMYKFYFLSSLFIFYLCHPLFYCSCCPLSLPLALGSFDESGVIDGLETACPTVLVLGEPTTLCSPTLLPDLPFEPEKCL